MRNKRYFIYLSYRGTDYYGWQVQPGMKTIQDVLEDSLSVILQEEIKVTGAGRTDTGVHASYFVAHFDYSGNESVCDQKTIFRLNTHLPDDISVSLIKKVREETHARFDAVSRTYEYQISTVKDPFKKDVSWFQYGRLDIDLMNKACGFLFDYTDFTSFSKLHTDVKTNNCQIMHASWKMDGKMLTFRIQSDRFLRNMVRAITGTMIDIGRAKIVPEEIKNIIKARNRQKAGKSVPPQGLSLVDIEYPKDIFDD